MLPRRATDLVCAALLLVAALAARLPGINGDLWLDEAWVANSILAPTWREMLFYEPWFQTTPPLYLALTRVLVAVLGEANWVFRALSLVCGVASVALAAYLGRRLFSPLAGWLAGAMIALSSSAVSFSKEGKQYSVELFAALLLIGVMVELPAWWVALLVMLLAFGLAYTSLMIIPGVLLAYLLAKRLTWPQALVVLFGLALPMASIYWFYLRPNQGADLREFWSMHFPQDDPLRFYYRTTRSILVAHHWQPLGFSSLWRPLVAALTLVGMARATWQLWRERDARLVLAGLLPFAVAIGLNFAGLYPYSEERFSVYLEACLVLLIVAGADWCWPKSLPAALSVLLTMATAMAAFTGSWPRRVDVGLTEARQELRRKGVTTADVLFVAPLQGPSFALEQHRDRLTIDAVEGRFASPCCPRDERWRADLQESDVAEEMDRLIAQGTGRLIWLLHLRLKMLTPEGRMVPEVWQRGYLVRKGCRAEYEKEFQSTVLSAYRCPLL